MTFYYYGVIEKDKLMVRMGRSHYDGSTIDFKTPSDDVQEGMGAIFDFLCTSLGGLQDLTLRDLAKIDRAASFACDVIEEPYEWATWYLYHDRITKIIPETELSDYIENGYTLISEW